MSFDAQRQQRCPVCLQCYGTPIELIVHMSTHTSDVWSCFLCDFVRTTADELKAHLRVCHFPNNESGLDDAWNVVLQKRENRIPMDWRKKTCLKCGEQFDTQNDLDKHFVLFGPAHDRSSRAARTLAEVFVLHGIDNQELIDMYRTLGILDDLIIEPHLNQMVKMILYPEQLLPQNAEAVQQAPRWWDQWHALADAEFEETLNLLKALLPVSEIQINNVTLPLFNFPQPQGPPRPLADSLPIASQSSPLLLPRELYPPQPEEEQGRSVSALADRPDIPRRVIIPGFNAINPPPTQQFDGPFRIPPLPARFNTVETPVTVAFGSSQLWRPAPSSLNTEGSSQDLERQQQQQQRPNEPTLGTLQPPPGPSDHDEVFSSKYAKRPRRM